MGFFLPLTLQRGEDVPSLTQCREVIFGQMVSKCVVEGKKDVGWRNVRVLPSSESTGEGVVADRGRYLMARERIG